MNIIKIWKEKGKILEGIKNSIFKKEDVEKIAIERFSICSSNICQSFDVSGAGCEVPGSPRPCCDKRNGGCGCSLGLKTRSLSSSCPKGLWSAELTEDEEDKLKQKLGI